MLEAVGDEVRQRGIELAPRLVAEQCDDLLDGPRGLVAALFGECVVDLRQHEDAARKGDVFASQTLPPMATQVCSTSMGVTLNHGILPDSEQASVLSRVCPAGAEMWKPLPPPAEAPVELGRLASYWYIHEAAAILVTAGLTKNAVSAPFDV